MDHHRPEGLFVRGHRPTPALGSSSHAKGAGRIAEKIRDLAAEHNIPVVEKKELAQNLYKLAEIGQEIPPLFYQAVAEVLAYIFRLKDNLAHGLK